MKYLISDLHLGHKAIINYANRPFVDVEEMNRSIISSINTIKYRSSDILLIAGDVSFLPIKETKELLAQIPVRKHLIMGNHDMSHSKTWWTEAGFEWISEFPICLNEFFWISHEPMFLNERIPYVNIHGHLHDIDQILLADGKNLYYNISCEKLNYIPRSMEEIMSYYADEMKGEE